MPFLARIKAALSGVPATPRLPPVPIAIPVVTFGVRRGSREVLRAYREDGWLRAIVDTVADSCAKTRWRVFKPTRKAAKGASRRIKSLTGADRRKALLEAVSAEELVELKDHELLRIIEAPHAKYTGQAYRKLLQQHLDLAGEAFLWVRRAQGGQVVGFELLPPHTVYQTPTAEKPEFFVSYNLLNISIPEQEVLWLKHLDPENPEARGAGRGLALGDEIDGREAIAKTVKSTMQRGGIPAAIVGVESRSDGADVDVEDALEDLQKRYADSFKGPENAGKVWFVPGHTTMSQVAVNFRELQLQELDKSLRDYMRQAFNVSPELLGDLTSSNRSTSEEAKYILAEYAIDPRLSFLREELQHKLVPLIDPDALLDYDDPRPQSWERTFRILTTPPHEGVLWNEYRTFAGLPPLAELDGKRPLPAPGAGLGGASTESASANATPGPPPRPE